MNPRSMPYEQLEDQWTPLLRRFASWNIPGMDFEDVMQEMRIVLYKAQQSFNPRKKAKFKTFLYRALLNRVMTLLCTAGGGTSPRKRIVPPQMISHLCSCNEDDDVLCYACKHAATSRDDTSLIDLLQSPMSSEARGVLSKISLGNMTLEDQQNIPQRVKDELRRVIKEDDHDD